MHCMTTDGPRQHKALVDRGVPNAGVSCGGLGEVLTWCHEVLLKLIQPELHLSILLLQFVHFLHASHEQGCVSTCQKLKVAVNLGRCNTMISHEAAWPHQLYSSIWLCAPDPGSDPAGLECKDKTTHDQLQAASWPWKQHQQLAMSKLMAMCQQSINQPEAPRPDSCTMA